MLDYITRVFKVEKGALYSKEIATDNEINKTPFDPPSRDVALPQWWIENMPAKRQEIVDKMVMSN